MKITIKYFASLREALGIGEEEFLSEASSVAGLREELIARGEPYRSAFDAVKGLRCSLNHELCELTQAIASGDEVAFFPPVTGG
jgi:molybdopterin synthase sulfur carrier subunit